MTWGYLCAVLRRARPGRRQLAPAGGEKGPHQIHVPCESRSGKGGVKEQAMVLSLKITISKELLAQTLNVPDGPCCFIVTKCPTLL